MSCSDQRKEPCLLPWSHVYYHTDKNVYPCCNLVANPNFVLGKTSDALSEIWNSERLRKLRMDTINNTAPKECWQHCYKNMNPLHVHVPQSVKELKNLFFENTSETGEFEENFILWNVNESNVCNFACIYCCSSFSNRFDGNLQKSFTNTDEQLEFFKQNLPNLKYIYFSSGESHLQPGYYRMLEYLVETNHTHIPIVVHSNLSGFTFGKKNLYELLNNFEDVAVCASLDSHGKRAEFIRYGTKWEDILETRNELFKYPNIKFAIQPVITNLNIWSLPDFHMDWFNKGLVRKDNIRYFPLSTPEDLHITVLTPKMKNEVIAKYHDYLDFLSDETSTIYNAKTPFSKVIEILEEMKKEPIVSLDRFNFYIIKQSLKSKMSFKTIFPEFS